MIAQIPDYTPDRRAVGQNDLGALKYLSPRKPPTIKHGQHSNLRNSLFIDTCFTTGNGFVPKDLICRNPKISADQGSLRRLGLRCLTVGSNLIAGLYSTAFLLVVAFSLPCAYPHQRADLGRPACRSPVAYYPRPTPYLRLRSLIDTSPKRVLNRSHQFSATTTAPGHLCGRRGRHSGQSVKKSMEQSEKIRLRIRLISKKFLVMSG